MLLLELTTTTYLCDVVSPTFFQTDGGVRSGLLLLWFVVCDPHVVLGSFFVPCERPANLALDDGLG